MYENAANVRQAPPAATRSLGGEAGGTSPIPTSIISHELERANRLGGDLHNLIERLEKRLVPTCMAAPPSGNGDASAQGMAPTELSRAVQSINGVNAAACERLASLLDRIDL